MSVLLTARFGVGGGKDPLYNVVLIKEKIIIIHSDPRTYDKQEIALADVIGAKTFGDDRSVGAFLHVYSYPKRKPRWGSHNRRKQEVHFFVCSEETQEGNLAIGDNWKHAIVSLVRGQHIQRDMTVPEHRKYLVLINPASGSGKAKAVYYDHVCPMLKQAEAEAVVIVTERAAHGQELIRNMAIEQLKTFSAIVIVSGDGLVHEVFNGLMERKDWEVAIQTPVAPIPGGSGNALVSSLLHAAGEPVTPTCAVFALLRGQTTPIDLATVQTGEKTYYSFLSLAWGLAADIDINSEKFRFLGNSRFTVSFLSRIVAYPKYRCRLHYLPVESTDETEVAASGGHTDKPLAHLLPSLNDSLSEDQGWKLMTGEFVTVLGMMLSHLSEDICLAPDASVNGGVIYLLVTGGDVPRMKVVKAFTGHLEVIELLPVRAMRLEPEVGERSRRSYMVLDGERIDYGAVQMEVHKGLGRVIALN